MKQIASATLFVLLIVMAAFTPAQGQNRTLSSTPAIAATATRSTQRVLLPPSESYRRFREADAAKSLAQSRTIVLDDGDDLPDDFAGFNSAEPFFWANEFVVSGFNFELQAFDFYMRTEEATTNNVYVAILDGDQNVLREATIEFELSVEGMWYNAMLTGVTEQFPDGSHFFIVIGTPDGGVTFPAGWDDGGGVTGRSYFRDATSPLQSINTIAGFENLIWLIRAIGEEVTESPPVIQHAPVSQATAGQPLTLTATVTDDQDIDLVHVFFFEGGEGFQTDFEMSRTSGDTFSATIPGERINERGFSYDIGAQDTGGASTFSDFFTVQVRVEGDGLTANANRFRGDTESAYRLVSIPFNLDNKDANSVLADDLGSYDDEQWRFFSLQASQEYNEFPGTGPMAPGRGFWLIARDPPGLVDTGAGISVSTADEVAIPLNAGWTFVGTPFAFEVTRANLRMGSEQALDIRSFNGSFQAHSGGFSPFEAYAVFANSTDQLFIAPNFNSEPAAKRAETEAFDWALHILAHSATARDTDNVAAVSRQATAAWDALDRPEPPPVPGMALGVYFHRPDWGAPVNRFSTDARPPAPDALTWSFEVTGRAGERIDLRFEGMKEVPADLAVWLSDPLTGVQHDLRADPTYHLTAADSPRTLTLVTARAGSSALTEALAGDLPTDFALGNFPNPFNPATTIRYGLPEAARVTLAIYNVLGERIALLESNTERSPGFHTTIWDGRSMDGAPVASGVYFYRLDLQTPDAVRTLSRSMVLAK